MSDSQSCLQDAVMAVRSALGARVEVQLEGGTGFSVAFRDHPGAVVIVRVCDPRRPSFDIRFPELKARATSVTETEDVHRSGVLLAGVLWILREVAQQGRVPPEFPDARVSRQLRSEPRRK